MFYEFFPVSSVVKPSFSVSFHVIMYTSFTSIFRRSSKVWHVLPAVVRFDIGIFLAFRGLGSNSYFCKVFPAMTRAFSRVWPSVPSKLLAFV